MSHNLVSQLNDLSLPKRSLAFTKLLSRNQLFEPVNETINLHCHTFFSYNAYGYSPTALAWLAKQHGFKMLGIVDFDALDGIDEFLKACDLVSLRGSAGIETRVFIPEYSDREINSPGEPGICYFMGIGMTSSHVPEEVGPILSTMRNSAAQRNRVMVKRINAYLSPVAIDFDKDVLPNTPAGNATERHLLFAYINKAEKIFSSPTSFWVDKLNLPEEQVSKEIVNPNVFQNTIRSKLMKRGGVGYSCPEPDTFPLIDEVTRLISACGALPCAAWLDGMSEGEKSIEELLDFLISKGTVAINIIPDRNWNIADPELRSNKLNKLKEVVEFSNRLDLPINIGTEMNNYGQKLADDLNVPELLPWRESFLSGADFVFGHTQMARFWGIGYQSSWANAYLPERRERNNFYTKIGRLLNPGRDSISKYDKVLATMSPAEILAKFQ